jgi:transcription initiation factor TFIIIB Brf1 subunit/transcription initiation factor TFIIB
VSSPALRQVEPVATFLQDACPSCRSTIRVETGVETFCGKCGLVVETAPVILFQSRGPKEGPVTKARPYHVRPMTRRALYRAERLSRRGENEWKDREAIGQAAVALGAPEPVVSAARALYRQIKDNPAGYGVPRKSVAATAFILAYREKGVARTTREIAAALGMDPYYAGRLCRRLGRVLSIGRHELPPEAYLRTFLDKLGWSGPLRQKAIDQMATYRLAEDTQRIRWGLSSPKVAAVAVALVAVSEEPRIPWKVVCAATGLTDVALWRTVKAVRGADDAG